MKKPTKKTQKIAFNITIIIFVTIAVILLSVKTVVGVTILISANNLRTYVKQKLTS